MGAASGGCRAVYLACFHEATAHQEQFGVLTLGEGPRRDGSRAAAKGVRLIVVVCAAAILGASASFGEVCPFHRLPRKYRVTLILGRTAPVQKTPETFG